MIWSAFNSYEIKTAVFGFSNSTALLGNILSWNKLLKRDYMRFGGLSTNVRFQNTVICRPFLLNKYFRLKSDWILVQTKSIALHFPINFCNTRIHKANNQYERFHIKCKKRKTRRERLVHDIEQAVMIILKPCET